AAGGGAVKMRAARRAPASRALAANLLVVGAAALVALLVVEILLRVLPIRDPSMVTAFQNPPWEAWSDPAWGNPGPQAYRAEPTIGYEHAPDVDEHVSLRPHAGGSFHFHTNNLGFRRDSESRPDKTPGTLRVLVLGDSHTDGYVDNAESFSSLLETALARRVGSPPVEVLNAGVVGYSPAQEILWYERHGPALAPDVVLLVLYAGNDVVELADPTKPGVDPTTGDARPGPDGSAPAPGKFGPHDRLDALRVVALTRAAIRFGPLAPLWRRFDLPGAIREVGEFRTDTVSAVLRECHGCFWQSLLQAAHAEHHPERSRADIDGVAAIAIGLDARVRARGGHTVIAVLPTRAQVEPALARGERDRVVALLGLAPDSPTFEDEIVEAWVGRFRAAAVDVISLREPLREAAAAGAQYYERDWHLGPLGHRTVAAALADSLTKTLSASSSNARR
ncbi:MAG: SGNH/GDSL hydrolase family protein, partial [Candidatus Binatia bacterium]